MFKYCPDEYKYSLVIHVGLSISLLSIYYILCFPRSFPRALYVSHAVWAKELDGQISISSSFVLAYQGNLVSLDTEIVAEMGFAQASSDTLRVTILMSTRRADCRVTISTIDDVHSPKMECQLYRYCGHFYSLASQNRPTCTRNCLSSKFIGML